MKKLSLFLSILLSVSAIQLSASDAARQDTGEALHKAAWDGDMKTVRALLESGAEINGRDIHGSTPLMHAAWNNKADTATLLLQQKADPDIVADSGHSALMRAAFRRSHQVVNLLLKQKANVNQQDTGGATALDKAHLDSGRTGDSPFDSGSAWEEAGKQTAQLLRNAGGRTERELLGDDTKEKGELFSKWHTRETDQKKRLFDLARTQDIEQLQWMFDSTTFSVDTLDADGNTLCVAIINADYSNTTPCLIPLELLIMRGADINAGKYKPLGRAAATRDADTVELLLRNKAIIDARDNTHSRRTALMTAATYGNVDTATLLLAHKADVNLQDDRGDTALDVCNSEKIEPLLKNAGGKRGIDLKDRYRFTSSSESFLDLLSDW